MNTSVRESTSLAKRISRHALLRGMATVCMLLSLGQQAYAQTVPKEMITPKGVYAWHERFGNVPPSGIAELYDGYPTGEAACAKRGAVFEPQLPNWEPNVCVWRVVSWRAPDWAGALSYGLRCPDAPPHKYVYVTACAKTLGCPEVPAGETPYTPDAGKQTCSRPDQESYTLTLIPYTVTIEPNQTATFTATVTKSTANGTPANVTVSMDVKVDVTSGGHDHGETVIEKVTYKRPKGTVTPTTSNSNNFDITFKATEFSGTHTVTATCEQCKEQTKSAVVTVKVPGLEEIPDSTFYALTEPTPITPSNSTGVKPVGATDKHANNHYLKPEAANYLLALAIYYQALPQFKKLDWRTGVPTTAALKQFAVNDASLKDGGKFDINGSWAGSHAEHKRGGSVDIRANRWGWSAIPPAAFKDFSSLLDMVVPKGNAKEKFLLECTKDKKDADGKPIPPIHNRLADNHCISLFDYSEDTNRHYHVRLLGD